MAANDRQEGGDHYRKNEGIQHWDYAILKRMDLFQYVITKYVERWRDKNGIPDLEKAFHYLEKYIEVVKVNPNAVPRFTADLEEFRREMPPRIDNTGQKNPFGHDPETFEIDGGLGV